MMENREIRIIQDEDSEVRVAPDSRKIEGIGIVFDKESEDLGGFNEKILPGSVDGVIVKSDILALINHDQSRGLLARSTKGKGSLKFEISKQNTKYFFEAPKFPLGDELLEGIRRGDIKGSSFAFSVAEEEWDWKRKPLPLRTIKKFDLIYDMSPCYRPAYSDTKVALRNLEEAKKEDLLENNLETLGELEPEPKVELETKPITVEPVIEPIVREKPKIKEPVKEQRNINLKNNEMALIKDLQDLKASSLEENLKIYELKDAENRTMTEKEEAIVAMNNQKMREWELQIDTELRKGTTDRYVGPLRTIGKDKEPFSLLKALRAELDHHELPEAAREVTALGKMQFLREVGQAAGGRIVLPNFETREAGDILAGTEGSGQEIVAEDKKAILPPLVDRLVFTRAGATYLNGLVGTVSIPTYAGTTVTWKSEVAGADNGGGAFSEVLFAPKRLTAYINVSKTFLAQDGVGAERLLLDNIANAVARMLEKTILGPGTLHADYPSGIGFKLAGIAPLEGAFITNAALIGLETAVDTANALDGNLAYITNSIARGILKGIDKGTSNDTGEYICSEENRINGYPLLVTNSIGSDYGDTLGNMVVFANWKDLVIAQWGGYDITVDPYSAAKTNQVIIVINAYFDARGLRGETTPPLDEYIKSFAALSIK